MKLTSDTEVSLVTGVCVLALAITSKYYLNVELDFISQYGPVWMFMIYVISRDATEKLNKQDNLLSWYLAIILVTLAVLIVYSMKV